MSCRNKIYRLVCNSVKCTLEGVCCKIVGVCVCVREQELEAYVSDSDSDSEWRGAADLLSPWERERHRREREESRRVLLELKSVLGIRTSEGERDKRKLLLFSDKGVRLSHTFSPSPCCQIEQLSIDDIQDSMQI